MTAVLDHLVPRLLVGLCAQQLGVLEGALDLTAGYARTREQFGRPIGTFQAVSQRLADGYIDVQGARLTLWQAAWRLAEGLPGRRRGGGREALGRGRRDTRSPTRRCTCTAASASTSTARPHRYFTAAKRLELTLGGATEQARDRRPGARRRARPDR